MRHPGRPKAPLPPSSSPLTERVRLLVDQAHGGNIREASRFSALPYGTLRDLYRGAVTDPSLHTVVRLASAYTLDASWLLGGGSAADLPRIVHLGLLPPDPDLPLSNREGREIAIPYTAGAMYRVFSLLLDYLESLPPARDRPILGGAREEAECKRRLTTFLLAPLLSAQDLGEQVVQATPPYARRARVSQDEWVGRLEALGRLWELALPDLLSRAKRTPSGRAG